MKASALRPIRRPIFGRVRPRPYLIRSVLLAVALGVACSALLLTWAEQQGGPVLAITWK